MGKSDAENIRAQRTLQVPAALSFLIEEGWRRSKVYLVFNYNKWNKCDKIVIHHWVTPACVLICL